MITYRLIKELIEKHSNTKDITLRTRQRFYVDLRRVYGKLCSVFIEDFDVNYCMKSLELDRSTWYNLRDGFELYGNKKSFQHYELYHDIYQYLLGAEDGKEKEIVAQYKYLPTNELIAIILELNKKLKKYGTPFEYLSVEYTTVTG